MSDLSSVRREILERGQLARVERPATHARRTWAVQRRPVVFRCLRGVQRQMHDHVRAHAGKRSALQARPSRGILRRTPSSCTLHQEERSMPRHARAPTVTSRAREPRPRGPTSPDASRQACAWLKRGAGRSSPAPASCRPPTLRQRDRRGPRRAFVGLPASIGLSSRMHCPTERASVKDRARASSA